MIGIEFLTKRNSQQPRGLTMTKRKPTNKPIEIIKIDAKNYIVLVNPHNVNIDDIISSIKVHSPLNLSIVRTIR